MNTSFHLCNVIFCTERSRYTFFLCVLFLPFRSSFRWAFSLSLCFQSHQSLLFSFILSLVLSIRSDHLFCILFGLSLHSFHRQVVVPVFSFFFPLCRAVMIGSAMFWCCAQGFPPAQFLLSYGFRNAPDAEASLELLVRAEQQKYA